MINGDQLFWIKELNLTTKSSCMLVSVLLRDRPEPRVQPGGFDLHLVGLLVRLGLALPGQGQHGARPRVRRAGPRPRIGAGEAVVNLV